MERSSLMAWLVRDGLQLSSSILLARGCQQDEFATLECEVTWDNKHDLVYDARCYAAGLV